MKSFFARVLFWSVTRSQRLADSDDGGEKKIESSALSLRTTMELSYSTVSVVAFEKGFVRHIDTVIRFLILYLIGDLSVIVDFVIVIMCSEDVFSNIPTYWV